MHLIPAVFSLMKSLLPLCFIIVCVLVQKLASLPAIEITPDTKAKYLIVFIVARKLRSNPQLFRELLCCKEHFIKKEIKKKILDYCICKIIWNVYCIIKTDYQLKFLGFVFWEYCFLWTWGCWNCTLVREQNKTDGALIMEVLEKGYSSRF